MGTSEYDFGKVVCIICILTWSLGRIIHFNPDLFPGLSPRFCRLLGDKPGNKATFNQAHLMCACTS